MSEQNSIIAPAAPKTSYSSLQIALHWLIAAIVLFQLVFGESMTATVDALAEGTAASAFDQQIATLHYWAGISVLALVAVRLGLRLFTGVPPVPAALHPAQALAARVTHWLFYGLLVVVPVTGLLGYYTEGPFGDIHSWAKPVFIALIVLHAAAALFHQLWLKDNLLMRMVRPARIRTS
jgi:cytochrome b561